MASGPTSYVRSVAVSVPRFDSPVRSLVTQAGVSLLLIVPGVILLRTLRMDGATIAMNPVYVPAASVLVLMASSLGVDLIGPPIGITAPLRAAPLLVALEVVCAVLLAASATAPEWTAIPWRSLRLPGLTLLPLALPLVAAAF